MDVEQRRAVAEAVVARHGLVIHWLDPVGIVSFEPAREGYRVDWDTLRVTVGLGPHDRPAFISVPERRSGERCVRLILEHGRKMLELTDELNNALGWKRGERKAPTV